LRECIAVSSTADWVSGMTSSGSTLGLHRFASPHLLPERSFYFFGAQEP
jgi:hypothetical protein